MDTQITKKMKIDLEHNKPAIRAIKERMKSEAAKNEGAQFDINDEDKVASAMYYKGLSDAIIFLEDGFCTNPANAASSVKKVRIEMVAKVSDTPASQLPQYVATIKSIQELEQKLEKIKK